MNRTKTYLAADWTGDTDAIEQLHKWNNSDYWSLSFVDVHEYIQARDSSLYCSIKKSLDERMKISKTFILIVGAQTINLTKGSCRYCDSYNSWNGNCARGMYVDQRSYIEYECEKAYLDYLAGNIRIVVLYNSAKIDRNKCPLILRNIGKHIAMTYFEEGNEYWNYQAVKSVIG